MTPAARAQRRAAAKKSRPGRAPLTPQEELDRLAASRLLKSLDLPAVENAAKRIRLESLLLKAIEQQISGGIMDVDGDLLVKLAQTLRALEGATVAAGIWDRTGRPRVQKHEFDPRNAPRLFLDDPQVGASWNEAEETHARETDPRSRHADDRARG